MTATRQDSKRGRLNLEENLGERNEGKAEGCLSSRLPLSLAPSSLPTGCNQHPSSYRSDPPPPSAFISLTGLPFASCCPHFCLVLISCGEELAPGRTLKRPSTWSACLPPFLPQPVISGSHLRLFPCSLLPSALYPAPTILSSPQHTTCGCRRRVVTSISRRSSCSETCPRPRPQPSTLLVLPAIRGIVQVIVRPVRVIE